MEKIRFYFLLLFSFTFFTPANAQTWSTVGSGVKGSFTPLYVFKGKLFAGGLDSVGKKAAHVACWDGKKWTATDSNFYGTITAMTDYNGKLYAGTELGPDNAKTYNLLRWNDTAWKYISSTNGRINALCVVKGTLYIGGAFTQADTFRARHIVCYNDTTGWHKVSGLPDVVWALIVYRQMLYAGGQFPSVERLNGRYWEDVVNTNGSTTQLPSGWVKCFVNYFDELYVCGEFDYLLSWDTHTWTTVGPFNGISSVMAVYNTGLFVGGDFTSAPGNNNVFHIVDYESSNRSWNCMGGVIYWAGDCKTYTGTVTSIALYKHELYVGGNFMVAGGVVASNIARWTLPPDPTENK